MTTANLVLSFIEFEDLPGQDLRSPDRGDLHKGFGGSSGATVSVWRADKNCRECCSAWNMESSVANFFQFKPNLKKLKHWNYLTRMTWRKVPVSGTCTLHSSSRACMHTVLSGAEEREGGGVDGPSLDISYFSWLQPISFLLFNPFLRHVG